MLSCVVIDDEEKARITLVNYIKTYSPDIRILAEADSVESGVQVINEHKPGLVFLDIMLSDGSAFNLLKQIKFKDFKLVFVTSYNQYAVKAFAYSAFDYLLKPIDIDELLRVLDKLKSLPEKQETETTAKLDFLENTMSQPEGTRKKIALSAHNGLYVTEISEIMHCESRDNYTMFFLVNDVKILVAGTLKEFEQILQPHDFVRTHKSHLVNFNFISKLNNQDGGYFAILKNGSAIPVSVRKKDELLKIISRISLR